MERLYTTLAILVIASGVILHGHIASTGDGGIDRFTTGLFLYSILPYAVCLLVALRWRRPITAAFGAAAALAYDLQTYSEAFIAPGSSTAALGLLFSPAVNMILLVPGGMAVGYLLFRSVEKNDN